MATMAGREQNALAAVESLKDQCDQVRVYDNSKEKTDLTDNGKFSFLKDYSEPVYYLSCDDDFIYPSDYVEKTVSKINQYGCIVTYHGRTLMGKKLNYYRGHKAHRWSADTEGDFEIDVAGTGVTGFNTSYFNPVELYLSDHKRMSDVIFSLEAAKQGKKIMFIGHKKDWFVPQKGIPLSKTIHSTQSKNCLVQGNLCDIILDLKKR